MTDPRSIVVQASKRLKSKYPFWEDTQIRQEVELILLASCHSKIQKLDLYSAQFELSPSDQLKFDLALEKRIHGEALQRILGETVFRNHRYQVSPGVFIPRLETEALVNACRERISSEKSGYEIGLGTGIISIELLSEIKDLTMIATEVSSVAIDCAHENAERILGPFAKDRLIIEHQGDYQIDWGRFKNYPTADFLVSNPPYLANSSETTEEVLRTDPKEALFPQWGGSLYFYEQIAQNANSCLNPKGWIALEIPHERSEPIVSLFKQQGWQAEVRKDLAGNDRILIAERILHG